MSKTKALFLLVKHNRLIFARTFIQSFTKTRLIKSILTETINKTWNIMKKSFKTRLEERTENERLSVYPK